MTLLARLSIVVPLLLLAAAGGLYLYSPPKSLDVLDLLWPGARGGSRIAHDVAFRPGPRGKLDVWAVPAASGGAPKPVLVFFYGGGWSSGAKGDYGFVARAFARAGYVVVVPDYRLVPQVRFPAFVRDAAAAVRWTHDHIAEYGGDPGRIVLAGHSAGAYLAVMLALDRHWLAEAGVDPTVVRAAAGYAGPYDFYPFDVKLATDAMGAWPDPRATQPISFARGDAPPLLLAAATADEQVRPRNAINLAAREHALGSRTTLLREYPGLSHNDLVMALSRPFRGRAPLLAESLAFFDKAMR